MTDQKEQRPLEDRVAALEEKTEMILRNQKTISRELVRTQDIAEKALQILIRLDNPINDNHDN